MVTLLDHWFPAARIVTSRKKRCRRTDRLNFRPHLEGLETRIVLSSMAAVDGSSDSGEVAPSSSQKSSMQTMAATQQEAQAEGSVSLASIKDVVPVNLHRSQILDGERILLRGNFAGQLFQTVANVIGTLTPEQGAQQGILHLELGPIDLNVLGLVVETSSICLDITADQGLGGAIGNLLNNVSERLSGPASLTDILNGLGGRLTPTQVTNITNQLTTLVTRALNQLLDAAGTATSPNQQPNDGVCPILDLSVGPIDLSLLGLNVSLDDCEGGPVTVKISAVEGPGNLLGNLLCDLTHLLDGTPTGTSSAGELLGLRISTAQLAGNNQVAITGNFLGRQFNKTAVVNATLTPPAEGQETGILHLQINPIHLDVLGLVVDTSPICLDITAQPGQGALLGNLLTNIARSLDGPAALQDIRAGLGGLLSPQQVSGIERQIGNLIIGALNQILRSLVNPTTPPGTPPAGVCNILDLSVGPVDLNLLGLQVSLDDCNGGPVQVHVTAQQGPGKLLGNLLCGLVNALDGLNGTATASAHDSYFAAA